jgi:general secretion pathway protein N|tara:strand:- start:49619 stop:50362 length:744 start_codon:yes stop_codon:yes gene_type:complete
MSLFKISLAVGIVTFVVSMILFAPARIIWQTFGDEYASQQLSLSRIEGTVWRGSASVTGKFLPPGEVAWRISPLDLMTGQLIAHLNIDGSFHRLTAAVSRESDDLQISGFSGFVQADAVNPLIDDYGLQVSGRLDLRDLGLHLKDGWIGQLGGNLEWSGGTVKYTTYRLAQLYDLPPLSGDLALQSSKITLEIEDKTSELAVLAVELDRNGWGKAILKGRLFDLANQPTPIPGAPDDVVLEVEEKIW